MAQGTSSSNNNTTPDVDEVLGDIEKLEHINKKQEVEIHELRTKALQNTNLFFIFQGVVLMSTSSISTSSLSCHHWWIPFVLSLLASMLNIGSLCGIINVYLQACKELDQNVEDHKVMRVHKVPRALVCQVEPGSPIPQLEEGKIVIRSKVDFSFRILRRVVAYLCMGLLVGFGGVVLYGCKAIPCHPRCVQVC